MEWKMFEIEGKFGSVKRRVFKVFRSIGLGKENSDVSLPTPMSTVAPSESANLLRNYSLEAELRKAQALMYWHVMDRPR